MTPPHSISPEGPRAPLPPTSVESTHGRPHAVQRRVQRKATGRLLRLPPVLAEGSGAVGVVVVGRQQQPQLHQQILHRVHVHQVGKVRQPFEGRRQEAPRRLLAPPESTCVRGPLDERR